MAYGTKYRLDFTNNISENYYIFLRLKDYVGDIEFITGTNSALIIRSQSNGDDQFIPILSKECVVSMHIPIGQNISIDNFLAQEDDQWNIVIYRELGQPAIFNGFIVVESSTQPLHDQPYQLTLRASDGLSLLKQVPLQRIEGSDFTGLNNMSDYVGHILNYLNPDINFRIYYDIYHNEMTPGASPFDQMQVYAKTFEKDETTFEDCFTVLTKICSSLQCRLFFEAGVWHMVGLNQYTRDYGFKYVEYSTNLGYVLPVAYKNNEVLQANIGKNEIINLINKDAILTPKLAAKSARKTYTYDIPAEIVCNQSFKRGEKDPTIDYFTGTYPNTTHYVGYNLDCWNHRRLEGLFPYSTPTKKAYIQREFDEFFYEKDRYAVLPTEFDASDSAALISEPFYVGKDDRVSITAETRLKNNYGGNEVIVGFIVLLTGDDGTFYTLTGNDAPERNGKWTQLTSFDVGKTVVYYNYNDLTGTSKTDWVSLSVDSNRIPVNGKIEILLNEHSHDSYPNETHWKNLQVEYRPYINNSFRPAKGDYNSYEQNLKINKTIDDKISISDSPKKIIKGALHVNGNLASPEWKMPDRAGTVRFGQAMALVKYYFTFRQFRMIEGTLKGLSLFNTSQDNIPFGFLPQYSFSDIPNQPTTRYILTSMEVNYVAGTWNGVLVSVEINSSETFSKYDFQYLFE